VHIEHIQKNRDPDTAILKEPRFKLFFDGDHFPVTGRDKKMGVLGHHPGGIPEEPSHEGGQKCSPES